MLIFSLFLACSSAESESEEPQVDTCSTDEECQGDVAWQSMCYNSELLLPLEVVGTCVSEVCEYEVQYETTDCAASGLVCDFGDGTLECLEDTDGDGLGDFSEVNRYDTDPDVVDSDEDGYSDGEEVLADSDPNNPESDPTTVCIEKQIPCTNSGCASVSGSGSLFSLLTIFALLGRKRRSPSSN